MTSSRFGQWQILWLAITFLSMLALGFNDNLRGPLFYDILQDFKLTDLQGAWFYSASSLAGFFASLASAYILKKRNLLQLLMLSLFIMAISLLGIGFFKSFFLCLIAAAAFGMSMGFMGVAQNSSIRFLTTVETQSRFYSALHSMYGLSSFLAPLIVGWGLARNWVWRDFFTFSGTAVLILFFVALFSPTPNWAKDHRTTPQPEKNTIRGLGRGSVFISFSLAFYVVAEILIGSRLSLYTIRVLGLNSEEASRYVTAFFLCLLLGRILGILVKIPGQVRDHLYVSFGLSFLTMLLGLYHNAWWFALTGFSMSMIYPTFMVYLSEIYQKRIGVMMSLAIAIQSISIVCMHQIVGFISDTSGIKVAFHSGLLFLLFAALFLWMSAKTNESSRV